MYIFIRTCDNIMIELKTIRRTRYEAAPNVLCANRFLYSYRVHALRSRGGKVQPPTKPHWNLSALLTLRQSFNGH